MIKNSISAQEPFSAGFQEGLDDGLSQGLKEGFSKGFEHGMQAGFSEGVVKALRLAHAHLALHGHYGESVEAAMMTTLTEIYTAACIPISAASQELREIMRDVNQRVAN